VANKEDQVDTEHWQYWDRLFRVEFGKETDRAAVILSVAMLDQVLETILRSHLCATDSSNDELFEGPTAPLSTFSARINMCHRLGLISARLCRDLHIIRRIRNEFAHNITGCTFETPGVRNRIVELVRSSGVCENLGLIRRSAPDGPKGEFQLTVSMFLTYLWMQAKKSEQTSLMQDEYIYGPSFWKRIQESSQSNDMEHETEDESVKSAC
jgi:hypothetical protein